MRLESAFRGDIVDAVRRSDPALHHDYSGENAEEDNYYGMDEDDDKKGKIMLKLIQQHSMDGLEWQLKSWTLKLQRLLVLSWEKPYNQKFQVK